MPTMTHSSQTPTQQHPATTKQRARIAKLAAELDGAELAGADEAAAIACGYTETLRDRDGQEHVFADLEAWHGPDRPERTAREASALITEMQAIASIPRAECYCGRRGEGRGKPCRQVHYYDGHYDYECGLS